MDAKLILLILLTIVGIVMLVPVFRKSFKSKGALKFTFGLLGIVLVAYGLVGSGQQLGWYELPSGVSTFFLSASVPSGATGGDNNLNPPIVCPSGTTLVNGICVATQGGGANYQPTATYTAKDKYATTIISGTSYYKVNSQSATTTAYTNTNVGDSITYWVSNTSYWVKPVTLTAGKGVTPFEATAWSNSTASITLYDLIGKTTVTSGASNISMGANDVAKLEIDYIGPSQASAGPFGGVMVFEANSTLASITCNGNDLLDSTVTNPFHITYTATATTNVGRQWAYASSMDDGSGNVRSINCEIKNGASAVGAGSAYYVKFLPANYYVSKSGDILLDTEKFADQDTTRTGSLINSPSATGYWGA